MLHADRRGNALCEAPENILARLLPIDLAERIEVPIAVPPERAGLLLPR
jgi:hypothetical protein